MLTGHSLRTASQSSLPARRRNTMASSSESKRASKYSPGDVGVNEAGTVKRRLESSVTIIVGLSHSSETAVKPARKIASTPFLFSAGSSFRFQFPVRGGRRIQYATKSLEKDAHPNPGATANAEHGTGTWNPRQISPRFILYSRQKSRRRIPDPAWYEDSYPPPAPDGVRPERRTSTADLEPRFERDEDRPCATGCAARGPYRRSIDRQFASRLPRLHATWHVVEMPRKYARGAGDAAICRTGRAHGFGQGTTFADNRNVKLPGAARHATTDAHHS